MTKVILDASALLALIRNETGANVVEGVLGHICMSSVNVAEVASILLDSEMTSQECQDCVLPFISALVPFDEEQAFYAAELKKRTKNKGLSLGDKACLALGLASKLPVYTADHIWGELNIGVQIKLIR